MIGPSALLTLIGAQPRLGGNPLAFLEPFLKWTHTRSLCVHPRDASLPTAGLSVGHHLDQQRHVRGLAQRSAEAAKEIKVLILDSTGRVETGNSLVMDAGKIMEKVVDSIQTVNQLIIRISDATSEQSVGVSHVGKAMNSLDVITQENAQLVDAAKRASVSLHKDADDLMRGVQAFTL